MKNQEIIREIFKRFKLDSNSIRKMEDYEYDLIYKALISISPEVINEAIESFKRKEFKIKVVKSSFH